MLDPHVALATAQRLRLLEAPPARVNSSRLVLRLLAILVIVGAEGLRTLPTATVLRIVRGREAARRYRYRAIVRAIQRLGPTFVKFGQIMAARTDVLSAELCRELGRLHDAVVPMSRRQADRALRAARAARPQLAEATVDAEPVGSGSIACVYRGTLPGAEVALKLKRPRVDGRMTADLALLEAAARAGQRLPKLRGMPMADLVAYISKAILGQLDFEREARNLERIRQSLAPFPDVQVPALVRELCTPECLVFEFLPGLDADTPAALPASARERLATVGLAAVHRLFFEQGIVHCDLHPGNLYVTRDERLVILDSGYCVELPARVRELIGEFFACLATGNGTRCGEIVLEAAVEVGPSVDREGFIAEVAALVGRFAGPGITFEMPRFGDAIYDVQQRYGIYSASDFAFPLMSLLVVESTLRRLWPQVDLQAVGGEAAAARPEGPVTVGA